VTSVVVTSVTLNGGGIWPHLLCCECRPDTDVTTVRCLYDRRHCKLHTSQNFVRF